MAALPARGDTLSAESIERTPGLTGFLLRLPQGAIAFDHRGRVLLANEPARRLLAAACLRVGSPLPVEGTAPEIRALADQLAVGRAPLSPRTVELADGRIMRVSGTPAHDDEPAILQLDDLTVEWQDDRRNRDFVRNAAHQLRTPLAAISSAVDVLEAGGKEEPETLNRFLAHIRTHTDRLARLTYGLLVLARVEAGEPARLDVVELRPLLDGLARSAGRRVSVVCADSLAALAETSLLHEALSALVDNAVKHAPEGDVVLTADEADGMVSISVTDTGPGIRPEYRSRVLEPFFRTGARGDGFGLGLSIASRAVAAMNGELVLDPVESGGRFTVRLHTGAAAR